MLFGFAFGLQNTLQKMENSEFEFHLTGSRFFGNYTLHSDYDFFVQLPKTKLKDTSLANLLADCGFKVLMGADYTDKLTAVVYRKPATKDEPQIDVQLCLDAELKCQVQENLRQTGALKTAVKQLQDLYGWDTMRVKKGLAQVWDVAIATVKQMRDVSVVTDYRM